jgi:hypothetical protein
MKTLHHHQNNQDVVVVEWHLTLTDAAADGDAATLHHGLCARSDPYPCFKHLAARSRGPTSIEPSCIVIVRLTRISARFIFLLLLTFTLLQLNYRSLEAVGKTLPLPVSRIRYASISRIIRWQPQTTSRVMVDPLFTSALCLLWHELRYSGCLPATGQ